MTFFFNDNLILSFYFCSVPVDFLIYFTSTILPSALSSYIAPSCGIWCMYYGMVWGILQMMLSMVTYKIIPWLSTEIGILNLALG